MMEWIVMVLVNLLFLVFPSARITIDNCERIQRGMHRIQVEAILGKPGDYRSGPTIPCFPACIDVAMDDNSCSELKWQSDKAEISIWINRQDEVVMKGYTSMRRKPMTSKKEFKFEWVRILKLQFREKAKEKKTNGGNRPEEKGAGNE